MRPSRRLLLICLALFAASALIIASGFIPPEFAVVPWVVLLTLALYDAAISPGRRAVSLELEGPKEVFSGEDATFIATLETTRTRLPASVNARLQLDPELGESVAFSLHFIDGTAKGIVKVPARRRGVFAIDTVWLSWTSPFRLWEITPRLAVDTTLNVIPNIRPVTSGHIDVTVRSDLYGVKENALVGEGSEFHQMREFTPGMDTRSIDWKRSARRRDLVVKEMQSERNHQVILALDNGYLMREEIAGLPKIDHAVNAALAAAWAAGIGGDLVGLYNFDAVPRMFVPPRPARAAFPALRSHMAELDYQSVASNHTLALMHLSARLQRRSLIVVFSDFADTTTAELLVENLTVLNRAHVIIFATFTDPEVEARVSQPARTLDSMAETVAASELQRERRLLLDGLSRLGVICIETPPGALTARLISAYLKIKAQELI